MKTFGAAIYASFISTVLLCVMVWRLIVQIKLAASIEVQWSMPVSAEWTRRVVLYAS